MRRSILIGASAGQGTAKTSWLLGKALTRAGFYVFNYRDYPSLIRGGHNFNVLDISDQPIYSHSSKYDIIIALDEKTKQKHQHNLKKTGQILFKEFKSHQTNNELLGQLCKIIGFDIKFLLQVIDGEFGKSAEQIKQAIEKGYNYGKKNGRLALGEPRTKQANYFISGSEAVASGAIASGLDIYIAYPMTPATPVMHKLAKEQVKHNFLVLQLENEIAVANAGLGASFAGARTMVGTSGGGFALMNEALSLSGMSQIPLVFYLAMRPGPGSGVPTYTSQGDLQFALNAGHGEFLRIVLAPGDANQAWVMTWQAFYLAYKHRVPVILLSDKHLAESNYTFAKMSLVLKEEIPKLDKIPGRDFPVRASSYEHNSHGFTIENADLTKKMADKRMAKLPQIKKSIQEFNPVEIFGQGKNLIVSWGSTRGAILDLLSDFSDYSFLQINYLSPFPKKIVKKYLNKVKKIVLIENNQTGLLGKLIAQETGIVLKNKILKYNGRPFTKDELKLYIDSM